MKHPLLVFSVFVIIACSPDKKEIISQSPEWGIQYPGIWKSVTGSPGKVNLLNAADIMPRAQRLEEFEHLDFPLDQTDIKVVQSKTNEQRR